MCILLVKKLESMLFWVQHNDKEWKFKEQHAKMWENIAGAKRYSRPVVSTLRGRALPSPPPFRRLWHAPPPHDSRPSHDRVAAPAVV